MYPALAVVEALQSSRTDILYVGSPDGMERDLVSRAGLTYHGIDSGQVRGMTPWTLAQNLYRTGRGLRQSLRLLKEWPADVVFVTGGYVTVPVALAAWRRRIPILVYLPDLEPGWAIRFLSRFADRVAVSFDEVKAFFPPQKVWVSGYPVRSMLFNLDRPAGYRTLGLIPSLKTLLILGGSRGAQSINRAVVAALPDLLPHCQVVHISGELDWPWVSAQREQLPADWSARYHIFAYMHEDIAAAFAVADMVVARAGAATLAEWPAVGLPSILVPYPYSGQHQQKNADFMVAHGAAVCVLDADLSNRLKSTVLELLGDETRLNEMAARARALSRPDATHRLAVELEHLAGSRGGRKS